MITGLIVLLVCQLIGDFTVHALDVPIPGPVVGMVLLFRRIASAPTWPGRRRRPRRRRSAADTYNCSSSRPGSASSNTSRCWPARGCR